MGKIMTAALLIAAVIYEVVGIAGYMQFGSNVEGNVLSSIARENVGNVMVSIVSISMALALVCHVPCIVWPLRSCMISAWHYLVVGSDSMKDQPSDLEWRAASTFIMVGALAMAILIPKVKTALSIVGSVGGALIVFIYPAAFHLAVVRGLSFGKPWLAFQNAPQLAMIATGVVVGIVCLTMSILNCLWD
jgi:amino acid permease